MKKYTFHTTLMQTIGRDEATFLLGHESVIFKTATFANSAFANLADSAMAKHGNPRVFVTVKFRVMGSKRYLVNVASSSVIDWIPLLSVQATIAKEWITKNASILYSESRNTEKGATGSIVSTGALFRTSKLDMRLNRAGNGLTNEDDSFQVEFGQAVEPMTAFKTKVEAAISSGVTPFIFADSRLSLSSVNSVSEKAGMFVKRGDWTLFDAIRTMAQDSAANILMVGPSGTGKTSIPEAYAQTKGMPTYTIDCATIRDPEEWFGYREAVDGSTKFVKSTFIEAVEAGNTVIILDEFNRIEPWLHNSIYALLDHRRQTNVHGEMVKVGKGTIFAATANVGSAFTGTFTLDAALTNRFDATIFTSFLDSKIEAKLLIGRTELDEVSVDVIIQVMSFLRKLESQGTELSIDISTRTSLKIANLVKHSELPFKKILDYVILSLIEDAATVKVIMDGVNPIINSATTSPTTS